MASSSNSTSVPSTHWTFTKYSATPVPLSERTFDMCSFGGCRNRRPYRQDFCKDHATRDQRRTITQRAQQAKQQPKLSPVAELYQSREGAFLTGGFEMMALKIEPLTLKEETEAFIKKHNIPIEAAELMLAAISVVEPPVTATGVAMSIPTLLKNWSTAGFNLSSLLAQLTDMVSTFTIVGKMFLRPLAFVILIVLLMMLRAYMGNSTFTIVLGTLGIVGAYFLADTVAAKATADTTTKLFCDLSTKISSAVMDLFQWIDSNIIRPTRNMKKKVTQGVRFCKQNFQYGYLEQTQGREAAEAYQRREIQREESEDFEISSDEEDHNAVYYSGDNMPSTAEFERNNPHSITATAGGIHEVFAKFIKAITNVEILSHMKTFSIMSQFVRSLKDLAGFAYACVPVFIQGFLCKMCPGIVDNIVYAGTGWGLAVEDMEKSTPRLTANDLTEAELSQMLLRAKGYEKSARRFITLSWSAKATEQVQKFKLAIINAAIAHKFTIEGMRPCLFWFAGAPQGGKTSTVRALARLAAAAITGQQADHLIFERGHGTFVEGLEHHHRIVVFPEVVGSVLDTNIANVRDLMAIPDGNWAPERAFGEKGTKYEVTCAFAASNYVYCPPITGFDNASALHERRTYVVITQIDPKFEVSWKGKTTPLHTLTTEQRKIALRDLPEDEKEERKFLTYRFANPTAPAAHAGKDTDFDDVKYPRFLPACAEKACATTKYKDLFGKTTVTKQTDFTFEQMSYITIHAIMDSYNVGAQLAPSSRMMAFASNWKNTEGVVKYVAPKKDSAVDTSDLAAPISFTYREYPKEDQLSKEDTLALNGWKTLLAAACTIGAVAGFYASYKLIKKLFREKPEEDQVQATYGMRPRTLLSNKALAKRRVLATGNELLGPMLRAISRNIVKVQCGHHTINGTLIDGQNLMTNYHVFAHHHNFRIVYSIDGQEAYHNDCYDPKTAIRITERSDLVIVPLTHPVVGIQKIRGYFTNDPPAVDSVIYRYNISQHATATETTRIGGVHYITPEESRIGGNVKAVTYNNPDLVGVPIKNLSMWTYTTSSEAGDCGALIVSFIKGSPKIIGMQCGITNTTVNNGYFLLCPLTFIEKVWEPKYTMLDTVVSGVTATSSYDATIHDMCVDPELNFTYAGRPDYPPGENNQSRVKDTPVQDHPEIQYRWPCGRGRALKGLDILKNVENRYGEIRPVMDPKLLAYGEAVARHLINDVPSGIPKVLYEGSELLHVDRNAAAGYGWKGYKRSDLILQDDKGVRKMHRELEKSYLDLKSRYELGLIPTAIYVPCVKDETLKWEKIHQRKSRTFQVGQLQHFLYGRHLIGAFSDHITAIFKRSPIKVGIDVNSREFHEMIAGCLSHMDPSDRAVMDIDYKNYDRSHQPYLFSAVSRIIADWYGNESPQRDAWIMSNCKPIEINRNSAWRRFQGMPSGMFGTSVVNSLINIIYIAASFKDLVPTATIDEFCDNIKMCIYGDDNLVFPNTAAKQTGFSFITVQSFLKTLEIEITPADKNAEGAEYINLPTSSFLKKTILWSDTLMGYVPFLKAQDFFDHCSYCRDNSEQGVLQLYNGLLREYFPRGNRTDSDGQIPMDEPTFDEVRKYIIDCYGTSQGVLSYSKILTDYQGYEEDEDIIYVEDDEGEVMLSITATGNKRIIATGNGQSTTYNIGGSVTGGVTTKQDATNDIGVSPTVAVGVNGEASATSTPTDRVGREKKTSGDMDAPKKVSKDTSGLTMGRIFAAANHFFGGGIESGGDVLSKSEAKIMSDEMYLEHENGKTKQKGLTVVDDAMEVRRDDNPTNYMDAININNGALMAPNFDRKTWGVHLGDHAGEDNAGAPWNFMAGADELSCAYFSKRWAVVNQQTLSYAVGGETLLFTMPLSPFQVLSTGPTLNSTNALYLSPTEFVAALFENWRGGLQFKFQLFGPAPISGRICISLAYQDFGTDPGYKQAVTGPCVMWDFTSQNREIVVEAPFISPYFWLMAPYKLAKNKIPYPNKMTSLGTMRVYLSSKITTPNTVFSPGPQILVSMRGSPTFQGETFAPCTNLSMFIPTTPIPVPAPRLVGIETNPGPEAEHVITATSGQTIHQVTPMHATSSHLKGGMSRMAIPIQLKSFAAKWATKDNFTITGETSGIIFAYNHPSDTLIAQADYAQNAMKLYKGDLEIQVFPRGNGWQGGAGYVWFQPYSDASTHIFRNSQLPGVWVDFSSPEPVSLIVPYQSVEEYFYTGCPDVGLVCMQLVSPLQLPTGGGTSIDMEVQMRWLNFESAVPAEIGDNPTVITATGSVPAARLVGVETNPGPEGASVQEETTALTDLVALNDGPQPQKPIQSTMHRLPVTTPYNLREFMKRPTPMNAGSIALAANTYYRVRMRTLTENGATSGAKSNDLYSMMEAMFCAVRGDKVFDFVFRAPTAPGIHIWAYSTNSAALNTSTYPTDAVFLPTDQTQVWPSSAGVVPPVDKPNAVLNSVPLTTTIAPGHLRVVQPFKNIMRCGVTQSSSLFAMPAYTDTFNDTILVFFSEEAATVDYTVYRQIGDSTSFGMFHTIPPLYIQGLTALGSSGNTVQQMPDTYFPTM